MENKKYHNARNVPKSKRKIVESKSIPLNIETISPFPTLVHSLVLIAYVTYYNIALWRTLLCSWEFTRGFQRTLTFFLVFTTGSVGSLTYLVFSSSFLWASFAMVLGLSSTNSISLFVSWMFSLSLIVISLSWGIKKSPFCYFK